MPSSIKYAFDSLTIARKNKLKNSVFFFFWKLLIMPFSFSHLWGLSVCFFSNSDIMFWPVRFQVVWKVGRFKDFFDNSILVKFNFLTTWYSTVDINWLIYMTKVFMFLGLQVQSVFYWNHIIFFLCINSWSWGTFWCVKRGRTLTPRKVMC